MLVLSRMEGHSLLIDDDITVTVLEIRGNQVRIGVEAPREVTVLRDELLSDEPA